MAKPIEFLTPVGRLVQGDCFEPQTKDQNGKPYLDKTGQPTQKYFVAVAFSKNDPQFATIKTQFEQIARAEFPHLFPTPGGPCVNPNFSYKIIDGDGIDNNGKPNNTKEGFAGCWILRASSSYAPKCFAAGKYQPHEQLHPVGGVNPIPRGHYVRLAGNASGNGGGNGKPGLYVNVNMIEWARVGDIIVSGPDASQVFGGTSGATATRQMLPAAGASTYEQYIAANWTDAQLIAGGLMAAPVAATVAPPPSPPGSVAPPPAAVAPPPTAVAPHNAILAGPQMLPAAGATTYAQYVSVGWTDAQLIAAGFMAAPVAATVAPPPLSQGGSVAPPPGSVTTAVAPPPTTKKMLPAAGTGTYEQYIATGWTDAQLVQSGFMTM